MNTRKLPQNQVLPPLIRENYPKPGLGGLEGGVLVGALLLESDDQIGIDKRALNLNSTAQTRQPPTQAPLPTAGGVIPEGPMGDVLLAGCVANSAPPKQKINAQGFELRENTSVWEVHKGILPS